MNVQSRLISFRKYKKWQQDKVAESLGLSVECYASIEKGNQKISDSVADKLSNLYQVPKEFFVEDDISCYMQSEVLYSNCTFLSGSGSGGYINHQYNDRGIDEILFSKKEEIKKMQDQIEQLQKTNSQLIELLNKKFADSL